MKKYINLPVSMIQSFQDWIHEMYQYAEMDAQEYADSLLKPFVKNQAMLYGTTVHEYLEKGPLKPVGNGFISEETDQFISWVELNHAVKIRNRFVRQETGWELEAWNPRKIVEHPFINEYEFRITGRVDAKNPDRQLVVDYKVKQGHWKGGLKSGYVNQYIDSWQWQYYLWMTGFKEFWYLLLVKTEFQEVEQTHKTYRLNAVPPIKLFWDDSMEVRCIEFAQEFIEFLHSMNVLDKLYEHQTSKRKKVSSY